MTGLLDQLGPAPPEHVAGVLAGWAVMLIALAFARRASRAQTLTRLRAFVGQEASTTTEAPIVRRQRSTGSHSRIPARFILGAEPRDLAQAGLTITPAQFLQRQLLAGLGGLGAGWLAGMRLGFEGSGLLPTVLLGGVLSLWLARLFLRVLRGRRLSRFETQFPSAVDALASALRSGLSLPQALDMLSREMPDPLGPEFGQVVRQLNVGVGLDEALSDLMERVPSTDVGIFATAVQIQYRIGGNLSGILRTIASTVRERLKLRREIQVLTAQQRMSGYVVSLAPVFVGVAIYFASPGYIDRLFEPGIGRSMLMGAGVSGSIGFFVMRRITAIEV